MPESPPDPQRPPTNPDTPPQTPPNAFQELRSEMMLRTGINFFSVLAGIACYYGAKAFGFNQTVAAIAGLIFALLAWIAARSLFRDFRTEARRRRDEQQNRR
jgi:hypothetical protein